mmetsp:Transcript_13967/g.32812  ORF Transcript_13967/g.32812 Transcript_13967/m.32812 type:complete len:573 (+) Transcript_13967:100-1818(+)
MPAQHGGCSNRGFSESLQHLQALHEQEVSLLAGEVDQLRAELEVLRRGSSVIQDVTTDGVTSARSEAPGRDAGEGGRGHSSRGDPAGETQTQSSWPSPDASAWRGSQHTEDGTAMVGGSEGRGSAYFTSEGGRACGPTTSSSRPIGVPSDPSVYGGISYRSTTRRSASRFTRLLRRMISAPGFDFAVGGVIVVNAATIGWEASITRSGEATPLLLQVLEYVFLFIYVGELGLRLWALGCKVLFSTWVQFDTFLVCCGCLDVITKLSLGSSTGSIAVLDQVLLVRIFRLARLARVLRLMIKFQTLWMLVQGLVNSLVTLVWTCLVICILLFVFAVLGLELLRPVPALSQEYNDIAAENFGSLSKAMVTLLQGLTLDSFGNVYGPVMLARPLTVFYFVPFMLVVSIALMNLVTALMVNFSLEQASKDKQLHERVLAEQKSEMTRVLEQAFRDLDTNNSGLVDLDEMLEAPEDLRDLIFDIADMEDERKADLAYIFNTLDFDQSGSLEISEFCEGLLKLHDRAALDSYFIMRHCTNIVNLLRRPQGEFAKRRRAASLVFLSQDTLEAAPPPSTRV